jgi:hypothetical protein
VCGCEADARGRACDGDGAVLEGHYWCLVWFVDGEGVGDGGTVIDEVRRSHMVRDVVRICYSGSVGLV